jgi:hypothetical protein
MIVVAVGNDGQFRAFATALGAGGMGTDPRFASNAQRIEHRAALTAEICALTAGLTMRELTVALDAAGVPCGPVNTLDQVFEEPQAMHRGLVVEQTRADLDGPVRTVASPIRLSKTPVAYDAAPPALGQDTQGVLDSAGAGWRAAGRPTGYGHNRSHKGVHPGFRMSAPYFKRQRDLFDVDVFVDAVDRALAAVARRLDPAEGSDGRGDQAGVDPDHPRLDLATDAHGPVQVLREQIGGEAELTSHWP